MNIPKELELYKRNTWKPIVTDDDGEITNSKFAGTPFLKHDEEYPQCLNCNNPMQLFLQLNLDELPAELRSEFGKGLIQLFYCINEEPLCDAECEAFFPFAKSVLARIIPPEDIITPFKKTPVESKFSPKLITGWEESDDYFSWQEGEALGVELEDEFWEEFSEEGYPKNGEKLTGYPLWVQGVEYPNCPECDEKMRLLFQIDSEDNLPFMFGDVGCGHITQCKIHKEQLAFGWACS